MSLLRYGPVTLNFVEMKRFSKEAIYQGPNYLYTEYTLEVEAQFNPGVQNDRVIGDGDPAVGGNPQTLGVPLVPPYPFGANPVTGQPAAANAAKAPPVGPLVTTPPVGPRPPAALAPQFAGATTARAVEDALLRPGLQLQYSVGGVPVLTSPLPGLPVDSYNGPYPLYAHVSEMVGTRTFKVLFGIKTAVNLQSRFTSNSPQVLSHNFTTEHVLDDQWFAQIKTLGRVVFDGPSVARWQANNPRQVPDDLRKFFLPVLKAGCKREAVTVKAEEDGVTLNYEVLDRELPIKYTPYPATGITKVDAVHSVRISRDAVEGGIKSGFGSIAGGLLDAGKAKTKALAGLSLIGAGIGALGGLYSALPVMHHAVQVTVQGDATSDRLAMTNYAIGIINARLSTVSGSPFGVTGLAGFDMSISHDITGKEVTVQKLFLSGPILTMFLGGATTNLTTFFPNTDNTTTLLNADAANTLVLAGPSDDQIGRGSLLEVAVASALEAEFLPNIPTQKLPTRNPNPGTGTP
jgi:hypothetical protein